MDIHMDIFLFTYVYIYLKAITEGKHLNRVLCKDIGKLIMEEIPLVKDIFKKCPYFKTLPSFELDF